MNAKRDHFDFVQKMRDRGIDVVEMHNLLTEPGDPDEAKKWILDNQVVPNQRGLAVLMEISRDSLAWKDMSDRKLAVTLIGGLSTHDFPR